MSHLISGEYVQSLRIPFAEKTTPSLDKYSFDFPRGTLEAIKENRHTNKRE